MKILPSEFEGVLYRSRMEARWAVFMRACGVPFEYEIEGFDCGNGLLYLPDFFLPFQDAFMEVKSPVAGPAEWEKIRSLSQRIQKPFFVFVQNPFAPTWSEWYDNESSATAVYPGGGEDFHYIWCECPKCGRCGIAFDGRSDRLPCTCKKSEHGDKGYNFETPKILNAYAASTRRFDNHQP